METWLKDERHKLSMHNLKSDERANVHSAAAANSITTLYLQVKINESLFIIPETKINIQEDKNRKFFPCVRRHEAGPVLTFYILYIQ